MTVTTTNIANMALLTIGLQKQISSLVQDSAEANICSQMFNLVQNWCFGLTNWNFARSTAVLTLSKGPPPANPGAWSPTYPTMPWLYEYALPTDFVQAVYVTNSTAATLSPGLGWLGEPQRFVLGVDAVSSTQQEVVLTNQANAILVYTALIANPTVWPWHFQSLVVLALARAISLSLTGNLQLFEELTAGLEQQINIALQMNATEGLVINDTTPEWSQATGINYPYRRMDLRRPLVQQPDRSGRNPREQQ